MVPSVYPAHDTGLRRVDRRRRDAPWAAEDQDAVCSELIGRAWEGWKASRSPRSKCITHPAFKPENDRSGRNRLFALSGLTFMETLERSIGSKAAHARLISELDLFWAERPCALRRHHDRIVMLVLIRPMRHEGSVRAVMAAQRARREAMRHAA